MTDAATGRGLADAQVLVAGTRLGAATSATGDYAIGGVPTGARVVSVRRIGYLPTTASVTVASGATVVADVALRAGAVVLNVASLALPALGGRTIIAADAATGGTPLRSFVLTDR